LTPANPSGAFEEIFRAHFDYVWRLSRRMVGEASADDVTQESFLIAKRRFDSFDGRAPRAWLHAIVRHVAWNHQRGHARRLHRVAQTDPPSPHMSADDAVQLEWAARHVEYFLDKLAVSQREAFVLGDIEGLTAQEIAAIQGVPIRTVYSRLRLARHAFDRYIGRLGARAGRRP